MELGLTDQVFIVTGGSRGLGFATAKALVGEGARVVVTGLDEARAHKAAGALGGPSHAVALAADNGDPDAARLMTDTALERFGRLDGAAISVGGPPAGTLMDSTEADWRDAFESTFLGSLRVARTTAGALTGPGGAIAFVLSTSVRQPLPGLAVSNGLRPGLAMAAKTMADELGPQGVRVLGLLPGRFDTDRVRDLDALSGDPENARARLSQGVPLRRYGNPDEFGRVAAFLLSPAASFVTGATIPIDGGSLRSL